MNLQWIIGHFKSKGGQAIRHALKSLVTDKGYYTILVQSNKWHISARRLKCQNCKKLYNIDDFSYNENFDPNNFSIMMYKMVCVGLLFGMVMNVEMDLNWYIHIMLFLLPKIKLIHIFQQYKIKVRAKYE